MLSPQERSRPPDPYFTTRERLDAAERLTVRRLGKRDLVAERYRRATPALGLTTPNQRQDMLMAVVHLQPRRGGEHIFRDEQAIKRPRASRGDLSILDHRHAWISDLREPFDVVGLYIPLPSFSELSDALGMRVIEGLHCPMEETRSDSVMLHLALSLLPALERPHETNALFADHVFAAMRLHLASTYGRLPPTPPVARGALAPWQERRAKEMLLDDLGADRSLAELAAACGLSVSHFARAFKASTGTPPHRWLLERRVDRAMELLQGPDGLGEIALACGFADQSHLTRVFGRRVGVSPAAWRRERRH